MKKLLSGALALSVLLVGVFVYQKNSDATVAVDPIRSGNAEQVQSPVQNVPGATSEQKTSETLTENVPVTIPEQRKPETLPVNIPATVPGQRTPDILPVTESPKPSEPAPKQRYKNGTYVQTVTYSSPGGSDKAQVSLTITNDKVTSAVFSGTASNPASNNYQSQFASGFKQQVVGRSLDGLNLQVVNGASLTTNAFNSAVTKIQAQAS